jgi:DNA polymerase-3 subunit alpha
MEELKRAGFIHLRVKRAYSLLEGAIRPEELAELAHDAGMPAVAVTDANNLFGVYHIKRHARESRHPADCRLPAVSGTR